VIRPRRLAHRGTVIATGFVIDLSLVAASEARRRVLALWAPGASIREHEGHLLITGLRPSRVHVSVAPGTPLVDRNGVLAAMPLETDEAAELAIPGAVVLARAGAAEVLPLASAREVDPAAWVDLGSLQVAEVKPLAAPPARAAIPQPPTTDIRTVTGAPAADGLVTEVAAALRRARSSAVAGIGKPSRWVRFTQWLSRRLAPRQKALPAPSGSELAKLSWFDRLRNRMAEALWKSRLGTALGRRHAAYLRRVLEMFDRGELEDALRHAIPLGGEGGEARVGVGVPRPRESLDLTFGAHRTRSVIPVADIAMTMMRDRYRAAASRLEQSGRIDEAAFVMAELLGDVKAAIALLERHGRFGVAARLAEGRGLEPGLIVRLWFLAGDRERAIDAARRLRAWADAVARLERSGDSRAAALRMLWADHLADAGDFVQAVEVAWPVESSRALVESWIDRGIALEGTAAARLLVKKLVVAPSSFDKVAPAMLAILGASDLDAVRHRATMIEEILRSPTNAALQTIARPALRALVRDCGVGGEGARSDLVERLIKFADDAALRADRPGFPAARRRPSLLDRAHAVELSWSAHDVGAVPVYDAAMLPGDRLLLALGELGVRIIGRSRRTIAQIDQPATKLVISDHGSRALAIIPRGQVQRVARLDLIERRGAYWCDAEFDSGASTFDGDLWIAARGSEVLAIDTTAARWRAAWGVEVEPKQALCSVRRDGHWFVIAVRDGGQLEHWHYEGFTLRARRPWQMTEFVPARLNDARIVARDVENESFFSADQIEDAELADDYVVQKIRAKTGLYAWITHDKLNRKLADFRLEGATAASLRLTDKLLTIGDDRGRVIVFDVERGVVRKDLRTS
jgi:hypothetical protein